MPYKHIVFDIDGTLLDTEYAVLHSLSKTLGTLTGEAPAPETLRFALGITGADTLRRLKLDGRPDAMPLWEQNMNELNSAVRVFDGIEPLLQALRAAGYGLGIVTSKTRAEFRHDFENISIGQYFTVVVCADDTAEHKPTAAPLLHYAAVAGADKSELLYIGDSPYDRLCAKNAGTAFALAGWGVPAIPETAAERAAGPCLDHPRDLYALLYTGQSALPPAPQWLRLGCELQFIAQAGLTYSKDKFDLERFARLREMAAELLAAHTDCPAERIDGLFAGECGFQTPKLDTRAAIFEDGGILLVQESNGTWALPGGWVDADQSIASNTVKEVREEAGLDVLPRRLIAAQDRKKHNLPLYAFNICKVFFLCEKTGGHFTANLETTDSGYFTPDALPPLALEKNTEAQIRMCFAANAAPCWEALFD